MIYGISIDRPLSHHHSYIPREDCAADSIPRVEWVFYGEAYCRMGYGREWKEVRRAVRRTTMGVKWSTKEFFSISLHLRPLASWEGVVRWRDEGEGEGGGGRREVEVRDSLIPTPSKSRGRKTMGGCVSPTLTYSLLSSMILSLLHSLLNQHSFLSLIITHNRLLISHAVISWRNLLPLTLPCTQLTHPFY